MTLLKRVEDVMTVDSEVRDEINPCLTCVHFQRCEWLISYEGTELKCDWSPSRYRRREG